MAKTNNKEKLEKILHIEEQARVYFETNFLNTTDKNLQRAYINLTRSIDYLNKYLESDNEMFVGSKR
jgi:hypothetical protein